MSTPRPALAILALGAALSACQGKASSGGRSSPGSSSGSGGGAPSSVGSSIAQAVANATEPYWSPSHVLILPGSPDPQDNPALHDVVQKQGGKCGVREVADGVYIKLQCTPFEGITGARDVFSPNKLSMLKQGKLHMNPHGKVPHGGERTEVLPDNVDHRTDGMEGPIKNQGAVGACTAFSLSSVMDNAILRLNAQEDAGPPGGNNAPDDPRDAGKWAMSPTHIWSRYAYPSMKVAGESMLNKWVAPLSVWPYSPRQACEMNREAQDECGMAYHVRPGSGARDPAIQREEAKAEKEALYKIAQIDRVSTKPVDPDAIAAVIAAGADVWAGIMLDARAWKHIKADNPVIPDWTQIEGGHAIALAGYRKGPRGDRQFLVHNSWGGTWGDHGFGWISEEMVRKHVEYAYAIRVEDKKGKSPPMTDDQCPENELIDADTGQCAQMCPGPTRRVNGSCDGGGSTPRKRR